MLKEPNFVRDVHLQFSEPLKKISGQIKYIIIHHAQEQGWDIYKTHHFHQAVRKWSGIGYNFFIEANGEILKGRGYHVGAHAYHYNEVSLGICLTGDFDVDNPTKEQLSSAKKLCHYLMNEFNIPVSDVLGHRELPGTTKTCPGKNFDMDQFRDFISKK
ncbi:peptidoglycan recognition protein family protein [Neobacillus sp. SAB-20_R2A]|uniref:peptidoglycan recognition protein family protein n=1 Tax=Neobacillus sp. SAB-20_R2A TaxID=3120519 RepID=UPI003C6DEB5C